MMNPLPERGNTTNRGSFASASDKASGVGALDASILEIAVAA
jgi:hypothetical protein